MPTFSIVSVCLNESKHAIDRTFESLYNQTFRDYEHIVIDGGSKADTLDALNPYSPRFSAYISEPDKGIYDAMNKAIDLIKGDLVFFLNVGDLLNDENVLQSIYDDFEKSQPTGGVYCNVNLLDGLDTAYPKTLSTKWLCTNGVSHQSLFVRNEVFAAIGGFDLNFKITADNDWLIRAIEHGFTFSHDPRTLTSVLAGGLSSDPERVEDDKRLMRQKYYSRTMQALYPAYFFASKVLGRIRQGRFHLPPRVAARFNRR